MNAKQNLVRLAVVTIALAAPTVALAGQCAATNVNNLVSWDQTEIAKGTKLATMRLTSVMVGDDTKAPYHMVSGECIGTALTGPDGKAQMSGYCARRDKDGDVLNEEWVSTDGVGAKGTWKLAGGTGKFAKAVGTGQYESTQLQGKMGAVRWVGECQ